jgi:hypothetical protein
MLVLLIFEALSAKDNVFAALTPLVFGVTV